MSVSRAIRVMDTLPAGHACGTESVDNRSLLNTRRSYLNRGMTHIWKSRVCVCNCQLFVEHSSLYVAIHATAVRSRVMVAKTLISILYACVLF